MRSARKLLIITLALCIAFSAAILSPMRASASSDDEIVVVDDGNGTKVVKEIYKPEVKVAIGEDPTSKLPNDIAVIYEDGSADRVPVSWNPIAPSQYASDCEFYVDGTLTGISTSLKPQCKVIVGAGGTNIAPGGNITTTTSPTPPTSVTTTTYTTTIPTTMTTTVYNIAGLEGKDDDESVETADIAIVWICTVLIIFIISAFVAAGIWKMWKARHMSAELSSAIGAAAARRDSSDKKRRR